MLMDLRTAIGLLRWRRGWDFEAAAQGQVQVDPLRQRLRLNRDEGDVRAAFVEPLLLEAATIGASDAQRGLGELQGALLFTIGLAERGHASGQGIAGRDRILDVAK